MTFRKSSHLSMRCRIIAAAVLVVWTSALALCTAHCSLGVSHLPWAEKDDAVPSCHAAAEKPTSCHDTAPSAPADDNPPSASCATFKKLFTQHPSALLQPSPDFVLYIQADYADSVQTEFGGINAIPRQSSPAKFIITPEVYLGPALHSLAPPQIS